MFCYQCEQTAKGTGCTIRGVCGKEPETATLQDLLIQTVKDLSMYARRARELGVTDDEINVFTAEALFATLTNVDFDPERFEHLIAAAYELRDRARRMYEAAGAEAGTEPEALIASPTRTPTRDRETLLAQGREVSIEKRRERLGETVAGLQELITYGLKGVAAYVDHAQILGVADDAVYGEMHRLLDYLNEEPTDTDDLLATALAVGELNLRAMQLLDQANTGAYGDPQPTPVRIEPVAGQAIVVSGHDLRDLDELLRQTEGTDISIYTHGEMLPAHGYPALNSYDHLVGNFGGAWQDQQREFADFPGAILMTTNCIQKPREAYSDRIFTSGLVGWPGIPHISDRDFSPVIEAARAAPGFKQDGPDRTITVGFGHQVVLQNAEAILEAASSGKLRHFFLIGGCDGAKPGRNYYTEMAQAVPDDCIILTLACGKYRFNKLDFGEVAGLPRLLDIGQCNDAYSAIVVAQALAEALDTDVNDLPLSLILSWYEQKAVAILLTLLHLGVQDIRLGPSLPAFVTPPVFEILQDKFNIMPVSTPQEDLRAILA